MTATRVFTPTNRLRAVLGDARAPTPAELVAAAERNVAELKPRLRAAVQQHREVLARLANKPESELFAQSEALGAAALAICEVASVCDMAAVGEAAQGVYAVVRALRSHGLWHTAALTAHIRSLLLLTSDPAPTEAETRKILDRLTGMRAFVGVPA